MKTFEKMILTTQADNYTSHNQLVVLLLLLLAVCRLSSVDYITNITHTTVCILLFLCAHLVFFHNWECFYILLAGTYNVAHSHVASKHQIC